MSVKKVPRDILNRYYELWLTAITSRALEATLRREFPKQVAGKKYFINNQHAFYNYCRLRSRSETDDLLAMTGNPVEVKLTVERRAEFLDYVAHGASLAQAADLLNVPLVTITEVWYRDDPDLAMEVRTVGLRHDLGVVRALERRALGYELDFNEERDVDIQTEAGFRKGTTKVSHVKHVPGSVAAQTLYLVNRLGWSPNSPRGGRDEDEVEYDVRERLYDEDEVS
jgi:hypothetical protein